MKWKIGDHCYYNMMEVEIDGVASDTGLVVGVYSLDTRLNSFKIGDPIWPINAKTKEVTNHFARQYRRLSGLCINYTVLHKWFIDKYNAACERILRGFYPGSEFVDAVQMAEDILKLAETTVNGLRILKAS